MQKTNLRQVIEEVGEIKSTDSIFHYLDILQDLDLIIYSTHSNSITLTEKGLRTEKLFK